MGAFIAFSTTGANTILTNNFATGNDDILLGLCSNAPATTMANYTAVGHITAAALRPTPKYRDTLNNVSANKVIGTTTALTFTATGTAVNGVKGAFLYVDGTPEQVIGGWVDPSTTVNIGTQDTYNVTFTAATMISLAPA